jgi:hypothetical protein
MVDKLGKPVRNDKSVLVFSPLASFHSIISRVAIFLPRPL